MNPYPDLGKVRCYHTHSSRKMVEVAGFEPTISRLPDERDNQASLHLVEMVGVAGFEPATTRIRTGYSTRLSHTPKIGSSERNRTSCKSGMNRLPLHPGPLLCVLGWGPGDRTLPHRLQRPTRAASATPSEVRGGPALNPLITDKMVGLPGLEPGPTGSEPVVVPIQLKPITDKIGGNPEN